MDIRPWPDETYELLNQAIIMTKGFLCDPDFEMSVHSQVVKAYSVKPNDPMMHLAMQISCMGHPLPENIREYVEAIADKREEVTKVVDELLEDI